MISVEGFGGGADPDNLAGVIEDHILVHVHTYYIVTVFPYYFSLLSQMNFGQSTYKNINGKREKTLKTVMEL